MDFGIVHKEHEIPTGHPSRDVYLEMDFELTGDQVMRIINVSYYSAIKICYYYFSLKTIKDASIIFTLKHFYQIYFKMNAGSFQFQNMHEVSEATRLSLFPLRLELALRPFLVFVSLVLLVRLYCV